MGPFTEVGLTPTWLVFRSDTGGFATVRHRLMSSHLASRVRHDDSPLWLPLFITPGREWQELADALIGQIAEIRKVVESTRPAAHRSRTRDAHHREQ